MGGLFVARARLDGALDRYRAELRLPRAGRGIALRRLVARLRHRRPGTGWAVASGALASGIGYAIWYKALPALTRTRRRRAAQRACDRGAGGILFISEVLTFRLAISSVLILGGLAMAIAASGKRDVSRPLLTRTRLMPSKQSLTLLGLSAARRTPTLPNH